MKKFKMPDSFTILFILIFIIGLLTWFVPAGSYDYTCADGSSPIAYNETDVCPKDEAAATEIQIAVATGAEVSEDLYTTETTYEYHEQEEMSQGLWQILMSPIDGFYDAVDIALFVLIVGGYINIVMKSGALMAGIGSLLKKFNGREHLLIPILMILFGIGGTTYGMAEETIAFYLLIVPIFMMAGYDSLVGVMVIMLGAGVGVLASTINPFAIGVASSAAGIGIGSGIVSRTILFIIVEAIAIAFTMRYAKKVKEDINNSKVADLHEKTKVELLSSQTEIQEMKGAHKVILTLFALSFVIMILAVIPWTDFDILIFSKINDWFNANLALIAGNAGMAELGTWWFGEFSMLFLVFAIIIGAYAKKTKIMEDTFIDAFIEGAKDLLSVALIIGLARGIAVVMTNGGMDSTLLYYGSSLLGNLGEVAFIIGTYLFYIPMSFLIPSTSGMAGATMPVMAPLGEMVYGSTEGIIYTITAYSAASGVVNIITPTSGVVMGGLALAKVPYNRWVKFVMPLLIVLSVVIIIFLTLGSIINFVI